MTIKDIANLAGVSKSTVSRYLNGGSISKKKAELIEKVIVETNYQPNIAASNLKTGKSNLIGIVVTQLSTVSVGKILESLQDTLRQKNYQLFIVSNKFGKENTIENIKLLVSQGVQGIILGSSKINQKIMSYLYTLKIPVIILGQKNSVFPYCKVDDFNGGKIMGNFISHLNKQNITYLSMPLSDLAAGEERMNGFLTGVRNSSHVKVVECNYSPQSVYEKRKEILATDPQVIVCASDNLALGVLKILKENNLSFPQDIKLASFGNYNFTNDYALSITSLDLDYAQLGVNVANTMMQLLEKGKIEKANNLYHLKLIKRDSTKNI